MKIKIDKRYIDTLKAYQPVVVRPAYNMELSIIDDTAVLNIKGNAEHYIRSILNLDCVYVVGGNDESLELKATKYESYEEDRYVELELSILNDTTEKLMTLSKAIATSTLDLVPFKRKGWKDIYCVVNDGIIDFTPNNEKYNTYYISPSVLFVKDKDVILGKQFELEDLLADDWECVYE